MKLKIIGVLALSTVMVSCGGNGGDDGELLVGVFSDSPVGGLKYATASQSGVTDADGLFEYREGETVVFSIGNLALPVVVAASHVTPLDIAASDDVTDPSVVNIARLLQSLDEDGDPENGISIPETASETFIDAEIFDASNDSAVGEVVEQLYGSDRQVVDSDQATAHFVRSLSVDAASDGTLDQLHYLVSEGRAFDGESVFVDEQGFTLNVDGEVHTGITALNNGVYQLTGPSDLWFVSVADGIDTQLACIAKAPQPVTECDGDVYHVFKDEQRAMDFGVTESATAETTNEDNLAMGAATEGTDELSAEEITPDTTDTEATDVEATDVEATDVEASEVEASEVEATEVEATEVEATEVEATEVEATDVEASEVEVSEVEATDVDATEVEASEVEATDVEATEVEASEVETTDVEASEVEATDVEASEAEAPEAEILEVEATEIEIPEVAVDESEVVVDGSDTTQVEINTPDAGFDNSAVEVTESTPAVEVTPELAVEEVTPEQEIPEQEIEVASEEVSEQASENIDAVLLPEPESVIPLVQADDITDIIVLTGQSNAAALETGYDATLDAGHERLFAYNENGEWRPADLHQYWDDNLPSNFASAAEGREPYNNLAFQVGKSLTEQSERVVGIIMITAPGEGISHWDFNSDFYTKIRSKVKAALEKLPQKTSVDAMIWMQGETDWLAEGSADPGATGFSSTDSDFYRNYYPNKLSQLIGNLRSESWYGQEAQFICGETKKAALNQHLSALNSDSDDLTSCAQATDLPTRGNDAFGNHFSAQGLRKLGGRIAELYISADQ